MKQVFSLSSLVFLMISVTAFSGSKKDIVETAESAKEFKILLTALNEADLVNVLKSKGPFTVLAPTDEAFGKLPKGTLESLLKPENKNKLISILKYHVISGEVKARKVAGLSSAKTILGKEVSISIKDGRINVGNANVIGTDIMASNGIIHVLDQVLLPPEPLSPKMEVVKLIEMAVASGAPLYNSGNKEACAAIYEITAQSILGLGKSFLDQKVLADLEFTLEKTKHSKSFSSKAWTLRAVLDRTYDLVQKKNMPAASKSTSKEMPSSNNNDNFKVLLEAKLPKGFPQPGPVNKIVVKDYPEYRAARVGGGNMQNFAFLKLFSHIKQNGISMTAPVEMKIDGNSAKRQDMAFLYGNTEIGQAGKTSSGVEVIDLPSKKFVSIGIRGSESQAAIKSAVTKLEKWLEENSRFKADGEPRLLGYNSPMVPRDKRFWEVQIPVKLK